MLQLNCTCTNKNMNNQDNTTNENIDDFQYDYESVYSARKKVPGSIAYIPQDPMYDIPNDISLSERYARMQELGKKQLEEGVSYPVAKHRCDDHLEDIVSSKIFQNRGKNIKLVQSVC